MRRTRTWMLAAAAACAVLPAGAGTAAAGGGAAVPWYRQQLRNDCEAAALRMVLAARGHHVGDRAVLARIGVDRAHPRFGRSGPLSGDPFRAFVGDPDGSELAGTGFGVYAPPVAAAARSFGLDVVAAGQGVGLGRLRTEVSRGHPAVVWVDYLWRRVRTRPYTAYDGRRVPYAGPAEHTVVVTGFSGGRVTVNDPARGRYSVGEAAFGAGYATYGDMAVVVR
ncbi:C39 family peptidase [Streptacidiphilus sp. ASG 303]|uniref:C39 family peptidase n=1 Tax=Streptacidiphilus sp. ASG 303 TaxID=2896847 RepID=UPI001E418F25|nr:C39 family peptidase [Streptacidiphilus sp. ASG 303]MCD0484526.1 C39 family peptidase [Streptacidiphilus sp. ASG 303]